MADALKTAIELHRDDAPPMLQWEINLSRMLDRDHITTVTEYLAGLGTIWERRKATTGLWEELPEVAGIYMFVWRPALAFALAEEPDEVRPVVFLYVGQTGANGGKGNLRQRYKGEYAALVSGDPSTLWQHQLPATRNERLARYLCLSPLDFWWSTMQNVDELEGTESLLIRLLNPPLNDQGVRPRVRVSAPVTAF